MISAIALLSDGGYSFSCAVLNCFVEVLNPTLNLELFGICWSGLWQVSCLVRRYLLMMCLSNLEV